MPLSFASRQAVQRRGDALLELTLAARAILGGDDDTVVSASEHACGEPGCGPQTIILILRPGEPGRFARINKPLGAATTADVAEALAPFVHRGEASPGRSPGT
jgi:hypothetical protein